MYQGKDPENVPQSRPSLPEPPEEGTPPRTLTLAGIMDLRADFWTQELWENQLKLFLTSTAVICGSSHRELMKEYTRTRQGPSQELFSPRLVRERMLVGRKAGTPFPFNTIFSGLSHGRW